MEMIREWAPHVLKDNRLSEEDFVETLEKIVLNQIKRMLNKREMPQIMRKETAQEGYRVPFGDHPLVGHIAIYSINLILLRLIAGKRPLVFDESEIASHEDGTRPWDRLIHIWRSWFALTNLNGLTAVMLAERTNSKITVAAKSKFQADESKTKLHEFHNVAVSLGDNASAGIAGLYLFDPTTSSEKDLDSIGQRLDSEGFDPGVPITVARLLILAQRLPDAAEEFVQHGRRAIEQALEAGRTDQLENVCAIIARALDDPLHTKWRISRRGGMFRGLLDPRSVVDIATREPKSARILFELAKQLRDFEWLDEFSARFLDLAPHEIQRIKMSERGTADWINWTRLLREVGRASVRSRSIHLNRTPPDFFERALDPRHLLELVKRNPEGALAYVETLRELAGEGHFGRFIQPAPELKSFDDMVDPLDLLAVVYKI